MVLGECERINPQSIVARHRSARRIGPREFDVEMEVTAQRPARFAGQLQPLEIAARGPHRADYSAWSVSFGLPWWRGWGFTYSESYVGSRGVASIGFGWGR